MSERRVFDDLRCLERLARVTGEDFVRAMVEDHFEAVRRDLTSADVGALYDDQYEAGIAAHPVAEMIAGRFPVNVFQWPVLALIRSTLSPGGAVLDVGAGDGGFVLALAALGYRATGVDVSERAIARGRARLAEEADAFAVKPTLLVADVEAFEVGGPFDVITMNDVVEHLAMRELEPLLARCRALLAPEGRVIVHTPNGRALLHRTERTWKARVVELYARLRGWRPEKKSLRQVYYDQVHINVMGVRTLARVAGTAGLSVDHVAYDAVPARPWARDVLAANMTVVLSPGGRNRAG